MLKISPKQYVDKPCPECEFFRYSQPSLKRVFGKNIEFLLDILRETSAIFLKGSFQEIHFL